jgi:hypothetical protein
MTTMIEDYAEYLIEQGRSAAAATHEFRLLYSPEGVAVHVFLENDDDVLYYLPEVRKKVVHCEVFPYRCGGRPGVLEAREFINQVDYSDAVCLFLIDRDYNDLFGCSIDEDDRTYITDGHSIENNLVCEAAIEVIVVDLGGLSKADSRFTKIIEKFRISHQHFMDKIEPLLAWSFAYWAQGGKPNFNNVKLQKVISVGADGLVAKMEDGFAIYRKAIAGETARVSNQEVRRWLRILRELPSKRRVRGKFELWFFASFLLAALTEIKRTTSKKSKFCVPTALREGKLFEVLGGRIPMPDTFYVFLNRALPNIAS